MKILSAVALSIALAAPVHAASQPNPQLALSVSNRLARYNIQVAPEALTLAQASALHLLMVSERGYINVRRKAETILRSEAFRD